MLNWFNASQAKEFANQLASFLIEKMSEIDANRNDELLKKRSAVIGAALKRIEEFKKTQQLNLYQKAQLGNTLKWRLIDAKFEREFADEITHLVMTIL